MNNGNAIGVLSDYNCCSGPGLVLRCQSKATLYDGTKKVKFPCELQLLYKVIQISNSYYVSSTIPARQNIGKEYCLCRII